MRWGPGPPPTQILKKSAPYYMYYENSPYYIYYTNKSAPYSINKWALYYIDKSAPNYFY